MTECQILKAFSWLAKTSLHFLKPLLYLQYYLNCKGRLKAMITQSKIDNASQIKRYDSLILQKNLSLVCSQIVKVYIFNTTHSKKNAENNQSRLTYWLCSRLLLKNSFGVRFFFVCVFATTTKLSLPINTASLNLNLV